MKQIFLLVAFTAFVSLIAAAQVAGCPDPTAINYDSSVTLNNGSCLYRDTSIVPKLNYELDATVKETSGLVFWKKKIYTHNDSGGEPAIYRLNKATGAIEDTIMVTNATNVDWEDIAQDNKFFYIGDFGNNASGNRTDLKIYKVAKADVEAGNAVTAKIISYVYEDQTDFTAQPKNSTNFDCESLIAYGDSLYLFSKDWLDNKTRLYTLPKKPGNYTAKKLGELDVKGLITGAEVVPDQRVIVLTGYSNTLSPFIYLLYDFNWYNFFGANKRKILLSEAFTQVEGICSLSPDKFFISNEKYSQLFINVPPKIQTLNLKSFLDPYYQSLQKAAPKAPHPLYVLAGR